MSTTDPAAARAGLEPYFDALSAPTSLAGVLTADWGVAIVGAVSVLVLTAGAIVVLSIALASAAIPGTIDLGRDAAQGFGLVPSAFGAGTTVSAGHGANFVGLSIACAAFPLMLYPVLATWIYIRFVSARLVDDRRRLVAFPVKLALLSSAAIGGLAFALPSPPTSGQALDGFTVRTNTATATAGAFCIVLAVAVHYVGRRVLLMRVIPQRRSATSPFVSGVAHGVGAALALVVLGAMIAVPAGVAASNSTRERVEFVSAVGAVGFNLGADTAVVALGANLHVEESSGTPSNARLDLWHFGAPPSGSRNPEPARFLLVLAPLLVLGLAAFRVARRNRGQRAGAAATSLLAFACTFALSFGLIAVVGRLNVTGVAPSPNRTGRVIIEAAVASTLGHAFLAGVIVAAIAALCTLRRPGRMQSITEPQG
jgi:hypothetical protein